MPVPRYPVKMSNTAQTDEVIFPRNHFEASLTQPLERPITRTVGKEFAISLGAALKQLGTCQIRFYIVGEDSVKYDELRTKLYEYQVGRLHFSDGTRLIASLENMPSITMTYENPHVTPVVLDFVIWSDFF